ncbi:MAG: flagellar biosynthesis anti-sigma factor FlgM [Campylobacterales bacterium]|nr:flagellar biosynthesis anti-sigma factor FlgM [Campylobacterales bacterium]
MLNSVSSTHLQGVGNKIEQTMAKKEETETMTQTNLKTQSKVEDIKNKIQSGEYKIDLHKTAEKMAEELVV